MLTFEPRHKFRKLPDPLNPILSLCKCCFTLPFGESGEVGEETRMKIDLRIYILCVLCERPFIKGKMEFKIHVIVLAP